MKRIFALRNVIGVIAVALIFSFTLLSTNTNVHAASSTATVTHVEVDFFGDEINIIEEETLTYPVGENFQNFMTYFEEYRISGISSSTRSIGGIESVLATVRWQKVETVEEQKSEEIPYETKEIDDPTLDAGETVIKQDGIVGEKDVTYKVTYVGGTETNREIVSEEITRKPVNQIVRVGTKVTEVKQEQKTEEILYETKEIEDPTLETGETVIKQEGVPGEKTITYDVTYVNDEEVNREVTSEEVSTEPVDEIILIGTKVTEYKEEQETEEIPYETEEIDDPSLDPGETVVEQEGLIGKKLITYKVTYVNGEEVEREIVSEEIVDEPVAEIIRIGPPLLKNGDRHEDVVQLKQDLAKAGFAVPGNGTTFFGNQTEEQVKAFQKYYGLEENGTYDKGTIAKVQEVVNSPLQNGKRHEDTVQLKKDLAEVGFAVPGSGTTLFGNQTEVQVKAFQKQFGLIENGIADEVTLNKLNEIANQLLTNGVRHYKVIQLKQDLAKAGFTVPGNGTTFFGKQTEEQVAAFQKYYGLEENGTYDETTKAKIQALVNSPLQNGKRHEDVVQLKKDLAEVGFAVPGRGTTLFGNQTEAQVKAFQKQYGLVQNGIADEITLNKLNEIANQLLTNGVRHFKVIQLKQDLAKAGFAVPGNGTNFFGKQTEEQVIAFQKYYGLEENGIYDEATETKIQELVNSLLQNGQRHNDVVQLKLDLAEVGFAVPGNGTTFFGKQTENQVKAFQKQYGLVENGIADEVTLNKLNEIANQLLTNGVRHFKVIQLKEDLAKAGFAVPGNGTTFFGNQTEEQVVAFQQYYGLEENGTYDEATKAKIQELVNAPLQNGKRHDDVVQLKLDLAEVGFAVPGNGTTFFGKQTENQVKAFQKYYGLVENGIADERTLTKIKEILNPPYIIGDRGQAIVQLKKDLTRAGFGNFPEDPSIFFGEITEGVVKEFQEAYGLEVNGIADEETLEVLAVAAEYE